MTVITFIQHDGSERMVDGDVGLSLMETALKHDVPGIDADCGGGAICGPCHCFVEASGDIPAPGGPRRMMRIGELLLLCAYQVILVCERYATQASVGSQADSIRL